MCKWVQHLNTPHELFLKQISRFVVLFLRVWAIAITCLSVRQSVHILQISITSLKPQNQIFWNLVGMIYGIGFGEMKNMASVSKNWTYGTMQFSVYISKTSKYRGASFKSVHS